MEPSPRMEGRTEYLDPGSLSPGEISGLLEACLDAVCVLDMDGRFLEVNASAPAVWRKPAAELLGAIWIDQFVESERDEVAAVLLAIVSGQPARNVENRSRAPGGRTLYLSWSGQWHPERQRVLCTVRDVTHARSARSKLRKLARLQSFIVRTQQEIGNPCLRFEQLMDLLCVRAAKMTGATGTMIDMIEGDDRAVVRFTTPDHEDMIGSVLPLESSFTGAVARERKALVCRDRRQQNGADQELARRADALSMIATPIWAGDEMIGVLKVVSNVVDAFDSADVTNLQVLVESMRVVLQRQRAERELARVNRAQQLLGLSNLAQSRLESEIDVLHEICRLAVDIGGYRIACVVADRSLDYGRAEPVASAGEGALELCEAILRARPGDPIVEALRDHELSVVHSIVGEGDALWSVQAKRLGVRSAIFLPLLGGGGTYFGVLVLCAGEPGAFGTDEQQTLQDMTGDLAFGLRHIRSQREKRRLEAAVLQVAAGVSSSNGNDIFETLCSSMAEALDAPAAFIARVVRHSGEPRARMLAAWVDGKVAPNFEYACAGTPSGRLLDVDEVVIADSRKTEFSGHVMGLPGACSYVGRRLLGPQGVAVGLLIVMWREPLRGSTEFITGTLRIFAARATYELERRQTEIRLREQANLLDQAKDAIVVRTLDGRVRYWNKGAERLYGWTPEESIGKRMTLLAEGESSSFDEALLQVVRTGEWSGQMTEQRKDGHAIPTEAHWTLVNDPEGRPQSILAINTDISRRLTVEAQLRQSQRLESIGQLTGGVAHDFNNLLTVILGNADLLIEMLEGQPDAVELAGMIRNAAQRGADLNQRLLAFARRQNLNPSVVDVNRLVDGMTGLLRRTLSENIFLDRRGSPELWRTLADPSQLESALLNLCINSRDAMPRGGRIVIACGNVTVGNEPPAEAQDLRPGEYVRIQVSDTGSGIEPENLPRVFEPFFTTKEFGKGTGLGLSMVYGFVRQSHGQLGIASDRGKGTTVTMYLPRAVEEVTVRPSRPASLVLRGSESILLAEDDALVRRFAADQLRHLGYRVIEAEDRVSALGVLTTDEAVDLLFTDVVMPGGVSGPELVEQARRIRPGLHVLYTSGYTDCAMDDLTPSQAAHLLFKPYERVELAHKIRAALSEKIDG